MALPQQNILFFLHKTEPNKWQWDLIKNNYNECLLLSFQHNNVDFIL